MNLYVFNVIHPKRVNDWDHEIEQVGIITDDPTTALFDVALGYAHMPDVQIETTPVVLKPGMVSTLGYRKWSSNLVQSANPVLVSDLVSSHQSDRSKK